MGLFDSISFQLNYGGGWYGPAAYSSYTPYTSYGTYGYASGGLSSYAPLFNFNSGNSYYFGSSSSNSYSFAPSQESYSFDSSSSSSAKKKSGNSGFGSLTSSRRQPVLNHGARKHCGKGSEYGGMSRNSALQKAQTDSRLEFIGNGGNGWTISDASFRNDIKYATSGTSSVLNSVVADIRKTDPNFSLLVTSALGTASSPHSKNAGHYNVDSVKLDFGGGMSKAKADKVASQLYSTGKFDFAIPECDGKTWHIDAQIKKEYLA